MGRIAALVHLALAVGWPPTTQLLAPQSAKEFIDRGLAKFKSGDYKGAVTDFSLAIEADPRSAAAYHHRGLAFAADDKYRAAISDFGEVIRLTPDDPMAYFYRGSANLDENDWAAAIADFDKAIALDPKHARSFAERGMARFGRADFEQAVRDLDAAILLDPTSALTFLFRGRAKFELKDYKGCLPDLDRAFELAPGNVRALYFSGEARRRTGDFQGAIDAFSKALAINPDYGIAFVQRGAARRDKGDLEGAVKDFTTLIDRNPQPPAYAAPSYAAYYSLRGEVRLAQKDFEGAQADVTKALALNEKDPLAYCLRGRMNWAEDPVSAMRDYNRALALDPTLAAAYVARAEAKHHNADYDGALADSTKAIDLDPLRVDAYRARIEALQFKGFTEPKTDWARIISDCTKILELKPQSPDILITRGLAKSYRLEFDSAILDYSRAHELDPSDTIAMTWRRDAKRAKGDLEGALKDATFAIEKAAARAREIEVDPPARDYYDRGMLFYARRSWREALADFRKGRELALANSRELPPESRSPDVFYLEVIWITRARMGDREGASSELKAYLSSKTREEKRFVSLQPVLYLAGELSEAAFYEGANVDEFESSADWKCLAHFIIANKRLSEGDRSGAREHLKKSVEIGQPIDEWHSAAKADLQSLESEK